jgi:hypothetical protein
MKNLKTIIVCVLLLAASIASITIAIKMRYVEPKPQITIQDEIKRQTDSVAVAATIYPDTASLHKLQALKLRIATARYNDSLQRAAHHRR